MAQKLSPGQMAPLRGPRETEQVGEARQRALLCPWPLELEP